MIVGEIPEAVDLLVVGGGPGGYAAAIRGAQAGRSVTLVDRGEWDGLGGTCLQVGCIPSKAMIELANAAQLAASPSPGLSVAEYDVDLSAWQPHRRDIVAALAGGVAGLMKANGVTVLEGELRFNAADRATVAGPEISTHLQFTDVIIATGSSPVEIPGLPFDHVRVLDSADVLALERVPRTACVVGAGYIGLELGTALAKLGSKVTVVEAMPVLLPGLGEKVAAAISASLETLGVELLVDSVVTSLADEGVLVTSAGSERTIEADVVIVAVGRKPNTAELGIELLGLAADGDGYLPVDESMLMAPHVAAIGDVTRGPALAHRATSQAAVAVRALNGESATFAPYAIPLVMFTDPEVAACGHTAESAKASGIEAREVEFPMAALGRSLSMGNRKGSVRLIVDAADTVIGAVIVGPHASELIAEATLSVEMCAALEDLSGTIHAHPTLGEGLHEAAELALGHPLHTARRTRAPSTVS